MTTRSTKTQARTAAFFLLALTLISAAGVAEARKLALVIGNDRYEHLPVLQRAVSDANAVSAVLRDTLKFDLVLTGSNLTRAQSVAKFGEFESQLRPGDTAFFFFSGHGVAPKDRNLLIPVDFPQDATQDTAEDLSQAVDNLLERVRAKRVVGIFVLDACRDNPLPNAFKSASYERGLKPVNAPQGTFVLLSAGAGQRALDRLTGDDNDRNSVFTRKLLPLLKTRGLSLSSAAKQVQIAVADLAESQNHEQFPEYRDNVRGEIFLLPADDDAGTDGTVKPVADEEKPVEAVTDTSKTEKTAVAALPTPVSTDALIDEDLERMSAEMAKNAATCDAFTISADKLSVMKDFGDFDPRRLRKDVALGSCGDLLSAMPESATAQAQMALVLLGAERNQEALPLFRKSAEQGIVLAMLALGKMQALGMGIPYDSEAGFEWLARAAELGSREGAELAQGIASIDFLQQRSNRGDAYAMYLAARRYERGADVAQDATAAARWLMFSIRKGSHAARESLRQDSATPWSKDVLVEIQRKLAETGQYNGAIDGNLGAGSQQAIDAIFPG